MNIIRAETVGHDVIPLSYAFVERQWRHRVATLRRWFGRWLFNTVASCWFGATLLVIILLILSPRDTTRPGWSMALASQEK